MSVDRCVCFNIAFHDLKQLHDAHPAGFEELKRMTGCGSGCGLCRPYIELMLRTGRTRFEIDDVCADRSRPTAARPAPV